MGDSEKEPDSKVLKAKQHDFGYSHTNKRELDNLKESVKKEKKDK